MTLEEIKRNAPEGATHYEIDGSDVYYYARDFMGRWCNDDSCGNWYPLHTGTYDDLDKELKPL